MDGATAAVELNRKGRGDLAELMVAAAVTIDLLAVYDRTSDCCFYIPAAELGAGRSTIHLRLSPALNNQILGTRRADDYDAPPEPMEPAGIEPATS
jgi:hypothetical protein